MTEQVRVVCVGRRCLCQGCFVAERGCDAWETACLYRCRMGTCDECAARARAKASQTPMLDFEKRLAAFYARDSTFWYGPRRGG